MKTNKENTHVNKKSKQSKVKHNKNTQLSNNLWDETVDTQN